MLKGKSITLSHIISGYSTSKTTRSSETPSSSSSLSVPPTSAVGVTVMSNCHIMLSMPPFVKLLQFPVPGRRKAL